MKYLTLVAILVTLCSGAFGELPIDKIRKKAEAGDAISQFDLGVAYANSVG